MSKGWTSIFKRDIRRRVGIIRENPIFESLSLPQLMTVGGLLHYRKYYQNEIIFREKEPGACMYIVISGAVGGYQRVGTEDQEMVELGVGDYFGEIALIDEENRLYTMVAQEDTEVLSFFRGDLLTLIDRDPRLASRILFNLSILIGRRLRDADQQVRQAQSA